MFRRIALAIIGLAICLGPTPFEQWHLSHLPAIAPKWVNRVGSPIAPPNAPARPRHDPNTCAVCLNLHAPLAAGAIATIYIAPPALLGQIGLPLVQQTHRLCLTPIDCRGPPIS
jgi:hypothetical protein